MRLILLYFLYLGSMPEWLKGADCKSAGLSYVGSNPTRPIKNKITLFDNKKSFRVIILLNKINF